MGFFSSLCSSIRDKIIASENIVVEEPPVPSLYTFADWPVEIHTSDAQRQRFNRANSEQMNIKKIDRIYKSGQFRSSKDYKTIYNCTLTECTCPDFALYHKPCKHMYRLAFELGVFSRDADLSGIPPELQHIIDDELSFEAKELFRSILRNDPDDYMIYQKRKKYHDELLKSNLIVECLDYAKVFDAQFTRNDIISAFVTSKCSQIK